MNSNDQKLAVVTAVFAVGVLMIAVAMHFIYPVSDELPEGYRSTVLAFEFATSENHLDFMRGSDESAAEIRRDMNRGQYLDMIFPFAYGGLIILLLLKLARRGMLVPKIGIIFAIAIIPADIWENLVMYSITSRLDAGLMAADLLPRLHTATWMKWWAISISAFCLAVDYFQQNRWINGIISTLPGFSIILVLFFDAYPPVVEGMALMVGLFFLWFSIKALHEFFRSKK